MNNLFDVDGLFSKVLTRATQLMLLGILWLVASLPMITMGAANAALYEAIQKSKRSEGYMIATFLSAYKKQFRKATLGWLLFLGILSLLVYDFMLSSLWEDTIYKLVARAILGICSYFVVTTSIYFFSYIVTFEDALLRSIKNAFLISLANIAKSFFLVVCFAVTVVLLLAFPFVLFIVPGAYAALKVRLHEKIYQRYA